MKAILISLIAILVLATTVSVSALVEEPFTLSVSGIDVDSSQAGTITIAGFAGERIPLKVVFTADENADDVKLRAFISGHRADISDSTGRFDLKNGSVYSKLLSLKLPSDIDLEEAFTLVIRLETKTDHFEKDFKLKVQREAHSLEILSVDAQRSVDAGSVLPVTVVLKNRGSHELDDVFVTVSIPALEVSKNGYFGDLTATDKDNGNDNDNDDAKERTIFLQLPTDIEEGLYEVEVRAHSLDVETSTVKNVFISSVMEESNVLTAVTGKEISVGQTVTYDLIIVNSGNKLGVYEIIPESVDNLVVSVDEPIVTVQPDSSRVVRVKATGMQKGTYSFGVNVNSAGNELVKRVVLSATVTGTRQLTGNVFILTVVLAIIFVVLLIVLIILLTRKPQKTEEGESYY